jgi:hypothetical protein
MIFRLKPTAITVILGALVIGSGIDRVVWVKQIIGEVNTANVVVADTKCAPNAWLEVAGSESSSSVVRYRCGIPFWPFYNSGESQEAKGILATYHTRSNG